MWKKLKQKMFGGAKADEAVEPPPPQQEVAFEPPRPDLSKQEPAWIEAADNPFGVRVLDVRPVTLGTLSYTSDQKMAENAVSYGGEDGRSFAADRPASSRVVGASLRFRAPDGVHDGALFIPREMEDKWAMFVQDATLILVRGWRREVFVRARITRDGDDVLIGPLEGCITSEEEGDEYTRRAVDFIVRTYGLSLPCAAPLLPGADRTGRELALECMSVFGCHAHYASWDEPAREVPTRPLRVMTRLHVAVIRGDVEGARRALAEGFPAGLRDPFGRGAVHYVGASRAMLECLREAGADVDDGGDDGTTALMFAAQGRRLEMVEALLAIGAKADAVDRRGFSALHRAAEMGEVGIARALLARGADPDRAAEGGNTPRSLAAKRGESAVLGLFPPAG
ncbi:MAG: ankyrin repeat domain-containing protein [Deltaproteobacteria bacterium]|nr:ankyrin repeat domain-containing protein [Myxococcales bacterium]MDP3219822.1 ankyrin repeat domain-containing protein [Deltaproteobacteria bacterium]